MYQNYETAESLSLMIEDIEKCLKVGAYYAALSVALSIPEICGNLEYHQGENEKEDSKKQYVKWFDSYVRNIFGMRYDAEPFCNCPHMNGEVCYELRNLFAHYGNNALREERIKEDIPEFILCFTNDPFPRGNYAGNDVEWDKYNPETGEIPSHKYLYVSVGGLCTDIANAARTFLKQHGEEYSEQLTKLKINHGGGKFPKELDPEYEMRILKMHSDPKE